MRVTETLGRNVRRIRHVEDPRGREAAEAAEALRAWVVEQIRGVEGQHVDTLTAAQQHSLLVTLLWHAGALTPDLRVRPLDEWVRR